MFGIFFSLLVLMALLSISGEVAMRVRLTMREPSRDKLAWWRRGADEVAATYGELFPGSHIPRFRRFTFWLFLACGVSVLVAALWRSN